MIEIKINKNEPKTHMKLKGSITELLAEMYAINESFYNTIKEEDPVAVLAFEIDFLEMITGEMFNEKRISEWLQIRKRTTPEKAEDIIKDLMEGRK